MKKIMFNDKYGLTDAVLQGRKTMTRRVIRNLSDFDHRQDWIEWDVDDKGKVNIAIFRYETYKYSIYPHYQPGEVVAVAQAYKDIAENAYFAGQCAANEESVSGLKCEKGWSNKMFVRADLMPHQIRITDIKVERLQDISEEDCLREGILHSDKYAMPYGITKVTAPNGVFFYYSSPREAFSDLIDGISGKGTWEKNPFIFAYSFELVK